MASTIGPAPPLQGSTDKPDSGQPSAGKRVPHGRLGLRRGVPLREGLLGAFKSILGVTRRSAAATPEHPVEAVHEYRKSIRRARALVELLRPALGKTPAEGLDTALKDAFAKTGDLRDSDILIATLDSLGEPPEVTEEFRRTLEAELSQRPSPAETAALLKSGFLDLRPLPRVLGVVLPAGYSLTLLQEGLERAQRRARRCLANTQESYSEENFHRWRRRLKELRYAVEILASGGSQPLRSRERALARLAQEVGRVTDLFVLSRQVQEHADVVPNAGDLAERIRRRADEKTRALLARGTELLSEPPGEFAERVLAERG